MYFAIKKVAHNFMIYNASAGSGKTYTLTKAYLSLILAPKAQFAFSHILALTFTNKAVNEMKERILKSLTHFAKQPIAKESESLFNEVATHLGYNREALQEKSKKVLQQLLHNYAFFEVSTIDKFNHRLIRTFAKDLKLPQHFEVQLDTDMLLNESVDGLLERAGNDAVLTEILVAFALEKINDNKSWDLSFDLKKVGKLLFNDANIPYLEGLETKTLSDFRALKKQLRKGLDQSREVLSVSAKGIKGIMETHGLKDSDFFGGYLPKFIAKITAKQVPKITAKWLLEFETRPLYPTRISQETKETLDRLQPEIGGHVAILIKAISHLIFLQNAYSNLLPLNLINALQYQLKSLCEQKDYLPISDFNKRIRAAIKDQAVPFIYERMGEQYHHFFIDEFQDTATIQWENLKPLLEEALVSEGFSGQKGSLLLVGDAKQAIYRWRGGSATQFMALCKEGQKEIPTAQPKVVQLPKNYRSLPEIVSFNNGFFTFCAQYLESQSYAELYRKDASQEPHKKEGGYVSLQFLKEEKPEKEAAYCQAVHKAILQAQAQGFTLGDICILIRKKDEGALLAEFLLSKDLPVISSESLLLSSHPAVQFLVALITYMQNGQDQYLAYPLLVYLAKKQHQMPLHKFIKTHLNKVASCFKDLYGFNLSLMGAHSLYDFCVLAIDAFSLTDGKDAYLHFFLEELALVAEKQGPGAAVFLDHWAQKKHLLSIHASEGLHAIQILTIHKSKGLEFPVVIYPFVETPIKDEKQPKLWLPVNPEDYCGFEYLLLNKNEDLSQHNPTATLLIGSENNALALDAFNLLYVALTRAEKALFVIGNYALDSKGMPNTAQYSGVLIAYLQHLNLWNSEQLRYTFGHLTPQYFSKEKNMPWPIAYQKSKKQVGGYKLLLHPENFQPGHIKEAQLRGQQLHLLLDYLAQYSIEEALLKVQAAYPLAPLETLSQQVISITTHPLLAPYYKAGVVAKNESEIIGLNGSLFRPDRLVFEGQKVTVIDYKTGGEKPEDQTQINGYASLLQEMGYVVNNKILVYVSTQEIAPIFVA